MTRSGGTWDEDFGANVITQTEQDVWEGVILARPECTPFPKPKGDNSFRPRIGIVGNDTVLSAPTGASSASIAGPSVPPPSNTPPYVNSGRLSPDWDLHELEQNGTQPNDNSQPPADSASSPIVGGALVSSQRSASSIPSTPATSLAKRRAAASKSDTASTKKAKTDTHAAMFAVSKSLDKFGVHFSKATGGLTDALNASNTNSSPKRRSRALELVAKES
ncbi:hypothetical protein R3P38DRAFT_3531877 [Favolaschia claudopus]|uniref:Uncharacterized protein n=1 Tax=Favolaschia claudopus TaxID=2862362 RepID=A0AAW0BIU7_9AGAR